MAQPVVSTADKPERHMRALFKFLVLCLFILPLLFAAGAWFVLAEAPGVEAREARLSHVEIARAQQILETHDPRDVRPGRPTTLELEQRDLALVVDYLLQRFGRGAAAVTIANDRLTIDASLRLPHLPFRPYLNATLVLLEEAGVPRIAHAQVGSLPIPGPLANWLAAGMYRQLYRSEPYRLAGDLVQDVRIAPGLLRIRYAWNQGLADRTRDMVLQATDAGALRAYHAALIDLQAQGIGTRGTLVGLLGPLFAHAQQRSRDRDPVVENQALLSVLGAWAGRYGLAQLVPDAAARPQRFRMRLERRYDFAQHFLTSAALAARGDGSLSDAVGLFKEMQDAASGSGFSFTDIAADRAGTRFGQLAVASETSARHLQQVLSAGVAESDIMPRAGDLPEHMSADEFRMRFARVGSPAFDGVMAEIDARIAACSLYRR